MSCYITGKHSEDKLRTPKEKGMVEHAYTRITNCTFLFSRLSVVVDPTIYTHSTQLTNFLIMYK